MPKIALIIPSLRGGGAEKVMVTLGNHFADIGYEVDLIAISATGPNKKLVAPSVNLVDLKTSRVALALFPLAQYLDKQRPAAVMSTMMHTNLITIAACYLSRFKGTLAIREANSISSLRQRKLTIKDKLILQMARLFYRRADACIGVSDGLTQDLVNLVGVPVSKAMTIYNPVLSKSDLESIQTTDLASAKQPASIIAAGRLVEQKDFETLIDAVDLLKNRRTIQCTILGEGPLREKLEKKIEELNLSQIVTLPGYINNPYPYFIQSEVFVLSSRWEGFPSVIVQAMACGTAIVSTDCPSGPCEILEHGKWGALVPSGSPQALANAIEAALNDPYKPQVQSRAMAFKVDEIAQKYLQALSL